MKSLNFEQMEMVQGGSFASWFMCGVSIAGLGVSAASLIIAPNPLSAVGYTLSMGSIASCFL